MLKALIKKEFSQLLSVYTYDRKKGKMRSPGVTIALLLLIGFAFLSVSLMFYSMCEVLLSALAPIGRVPLYFALSALTTVAVGTFGSVFMTYAMLYKAKDNELLLAMPIPPSALLLARMIAVVISCFFICAIVWLPGVVAYARMIGIGFPSFLYMMLDLLVLTALVTVLTCLLGWIVALISRHLRSKTLVTVLLSVIFVVVYYVLYFRMADILRSVVDHIDSISASMNGWGLPLIYFGRGAAGETIPFVICLIAVFVFFAAAYLVLSKTMLKIITAPDSVKRSSKTERAEKLSSIPAALLRREFKRFVSSPVVLLNTGFGILMMAAGIFFALFKADFLRDRIQELIVPKGLAPLLPVAAVILVSFIASMDCMTASSVSLEGKRIWILQSMPVDAKLVLNAKTKAQVLLNAVPAVLTEAAVAPVIRSNIWETALMCAATALYVWFLSEFGLMMNLKRPNLEWENEAIPVKQSMSVMFTMIGGWGMVLLMGALGMLLLNKVPAFVTLIAICAAELALALLIRRWLVKKGANEFAHLY